MAFTLSAGQPGSEPVSERLAFSSPEAPFGRSRVTQVSANPPLSPAALPPPLLKLFLLTNNHQEMVKTQDLGYCSQGIALLGGHVWCVTLQNVWRPCF